MYKYSPEEVKKIAVIGAGTMGPGIAQAFAMGGYIVDVWEPVEKNRELARVRVRDGVATSVSMGDIAPEEEAAVAGRVRFADSLKAAVEDAQLIVECIVEKVDAKISLYTELAALNKDAIIASNTSALNIFEVVPPELLDRQLLCTGTPRPSWSRWWRWSRAKARPRSWRTPCWRCCASAARSRCR